MTFIQSDAIRDYVVPLITINADSGSMKSFLGTGFFIGTRGVIVTAAHVIRAAGEDRVHPLFAEEDGWQVVPPEAAESHPQHDIAVIKVSGGPWRSIFRLSDQWHGSSAPYALWGYPDDVTREIVDHGMAQFRPDLVYVEGYVRRRVDARVLPPPFSGSHFELSDPAGSGCSGAPIIMKTTVGQPLWQVIGIYLGERRSDGVHVGYAAMFEIIGSWAPTCIGRSLIEESTVS